MARFDLHGSTFAGNAFACVAALETLAILDEEGLAANSAARGTQLLEGLRRRLAGHALVRDVRGRGLLVGIALGFADSGAVSRLAPERLKEAATGVFGQWLALKLLERRIVCQPATHQWNVLKLEPPLTVQAPDVEQVVGAVGEVLEEYREVGPLVRDITKRVGKQLIEGWTP